MPREWTRSVLARTIDHTVLKAIATEQQVRELCVEARANGFASVCVNPYWVPLCARELAGSKVVLCAAVGFPLGADATAVKAEAAKLAARQGAQELDVVINVGAAKSGDWRAVEDDLREVVKAAGKAAVKAVLETCYLNDAEKARACEAAGKAGARFVATGTGFGPEADAVEDVRLVRKIVGDRMGVKAVGGIRSYHDAIKMLEAGADRLGTSAGVTIICELPE